MRHFSIIIIVVSNVTGSGGTALKTTLFHSKQLHLQSYYYLHCLEYAIQTVEKELRLLKRIIKTGGAYVGRKHSVLRLCVFNNMKCEYHVKAGIHTITIMTQSQSPKGAASSYTIYPDPPPMTQDGHISHEA